METKITRNVETFGLNENQHELIITMLRDNVQSVGDYYLDSFDPDDMDMWLDHTEWTEDHNFVCDAKNSNADVYTFSHCKMGCDKVIGYIAVYNEDRSFSGNDSESTQNNELIDIENKLIRLVNIFDDVNESLRHLASRLLMDTSEDNQMDVSIIIETNEDQGLSTLDKPTVTKIYQDPSEGIIWVLFDGYKDYMEWDDLTYSDQYQILKYIQEKM
jgi:hypothetical protein